MLTTCPHPESLQGLALGKLSEAESEELLDHLRDCSTCQSQLEESEWLEDTLVGQLRESTVERSFSSDPELKIAMGRALGALVQAGEAGESASLPDTIGEYAIVRRIGRGGMGNVYLATHTKLNRLVALKVVASHRLSDPRMHGRFQAEMRAVGALSHPNVVTAHDAREVDGLAALVTEWIDGLDVGEIVRRTGPLSVADACAIGEQVASALEYIRSQGLVHRDIKPSNIMVSRNGEVKLLDLGLARFQADDGSLGEATSTGQALGTADYVSPEQIRSARDVDIRADLYSLGCTLFKVLTGHAPFGDEQFPTAFAKMTAHVSTAPPSLRVVAPQTPGPVADLVERLLSKAPEARPQSPSEASAILARHARSAALPKLVELAVNTPSREPRPVPKLDASASVAPLWRKRVPLAAAVAAGLLGLAIGLAAGIIITIRHADGRVSRVETPSGSNSKVDANGNVEITLPKQGGGRAMRDMGSAPMNSGGSGLDGMGAGAMGLGGADGGEMGLGGLGLPGMGYGGSAGGMGVPGMGNAGGSDGGVSGAAAAGFGEAAGMGSEGGGSGSADMGMAPARRMASASPGDPRLAGAWRVTSVTDGGNALPLAGVSETALFRDSMYTLIRNGRITDIMSYVAEPTLPFGQLEFTWQSARIRGIYRVDDKGLDICLDRTPNAPFPKSFASPKDAQHITLVRMAKADDELTQQSVMLLQAELGKRALAGEQALVSDSLYFGVVLQEDPAGKILLPSGAKPAPALEWLFSPRDEARRVQSLNHLKQIAIAFHNYNDAYRSFPASRGVAPSAPKGTPPISWRVAILPFINEASLYDQYRRDEPWDSPANLKLLPKMPAIYRHPKESPDATTTSYVAFAGANTAVGLDAPVSMHMITDGTANTLLLVEHQSQIPWTKPEDLAYADGQPLPQIRPFDDKSVAAALADGSVQRFALPLKYEELRAWITRDGNEPILRE